MNLQELLNKYKINVDINMILDMWNESHRHYHNLNHLSNLIDKIEFGNYPEKFKEKLILVALFHDVIYDPKKTDNEEKSASFFIGLCKGNTEDTLEIKKAILDTKYYKSTTELSKEFNKLDMSIVESDFDTLLEWEKGIGLEFNFSEDYKEKRLKFIESLLDKYPENTENLLKLIDWIKLNY